MHSKNMISMYIFFKKYCLNKSYNYILSGRNIIGSEMYGKINSLLLIG